MSPTDSNVDFLWDFCPPPLNTSIVLENDLGLSLEIFFMWDTWKETFFLLPIASDFAVEHCKMSKFSDEKRGA